MNAGDTKAVALVWSSKLREGMHSNIDRDAIQWHRDYKKKLANSLQGMKKFNMNEFTAIDT